ncbi:FecCD family ABC transporter permease [Nigerium massiliense]|uniref:FecCD family ABC transporter permease n=1 Tax=Nigerium massiliense TaxID=1522317 RepID=UPI001F4801FF|nr:iron chelate uptake ABC transporter family permease subunit [Nigerium massiliense]
MSTRTEADAGAPARRGARRRPRSLRLPGLLVCAALLVLTLVASVALGARSVPFADVVASVLGMPTSDAAAAVVALRLPRTVIGLLAGIGLGVAGALAQAVTRNPLADPGILGTTAGAGFAVAMVAGLAGLGSPLGLLATAFAGAAIATVVVYAIGSFGRDGGSPVRLVLAGTALGAVLTGITSAMVLSDPERFQIMQTWRAGSLAGRGWDGLGPAALFLLAGLALALSVAPSLNAVALGDSLATSLGANVALVRSLSVVAVALLAGTATAIAGPVAFIGLMVPHIARWFTGPDQRWVLGYSVLLGPVLLLAADVAGRFLMPPGELPAGIVTALIGAPVLIALVRGRNAGEL